MQIPFLKIAHRQCISLAVASLFFSAFSLPLIAQNAMPAPNWDRELALQEARQFSNDQQLESWFEGLRNDQAGEVLESVLIYALSEDLSAPVKERQLHRLTLGLADFPSSSIPADLINFLGNYKPETLVAHEENNYSAVPLFNIPAAAQGLKHGHERAQGQLQSAGLLKTDSDKWIQTYVTASAAMQRGYLDPLQYASPPQLERLANAAINSLEKEPDLSTVIGTLALHSKDIAILEEVLCHQTGSYLAPLLRDVSLRLPESDRVQLLHTAIESAPAENAALALALLAPNLQNSSDITETLFSLLEDTELGSSAALALARHPDPQVNSRLQSLADKQGPSSRRAHMALDLSDQPGSSGSEQ
jgi:hypothetical protein